MRVALMLLLIVAGALQSGAQQPGSISGTITIKNKVKTEGPKSEKYVVVYLESADGVEFPPPEAHGTMDQKNLVFIPHVMAIQKGGTVDFLNGDNVEHNVFSPDKCCKMDLGNWGKGGSKEFTFNKAGVGVMLCNIHPEMAAYVAVVPSPYYTVAAVSAETKSASFAIKNVKAGNYILKTWNKKLKEYKKQIAIKAGENLTLNFDLIK